MPLESRDVLSRLPLRFVYLLQLTINHRVKLNVVESGNGSFAKGAARRHSGGDLLRRCGSVNRVSI
jgi:hypothetical protein